MERLIEIVDDILDMLDTNAEADHLRAERPASMPGKIDPFAIHHGSGRFGCRIPRARGDSGGAGVKLLFFR